MRGARIGGLRCAECRPFLGRRCRQGNLQIHEEIEQAAKADAAESAKLAMALDESR
jgi:hypothetical protein